MPVPAWLRKRDHVLWDTADVIVKRVGEEAYAIRTDTREVIAHGKDHAEVIQKAISEGNCILIRGEFNIVRPLDIDKSILITGLGAEHSVLKNVSSSTLIRLTKDNISVTLAHLTIDGNEVGTFNLYTENAVDVKLYGIHSKRHKDIGIYLGGNVKSVVIMFSKFTLPLVENDQVAIAVNDWGIIYGNIFDRRGGVENGSSLTSGHARRLIIAGNVFVSSFGNDDFGISLEPYKVFDDNQDYSFYDVLIYGNVLVNRKINVGRRSEIAGKVYGVIIENNLVHGAQIQVLAPDSGGVEKIGIHGNTVLYPRQRGITVDGNASDVEISENIIVESNLGNSSNTTLNALITLYSCKKVKVLRNILYQTLTSPDNVSPYALSIISSDNVLIQDNDFINENGKPILYTYNSTYKIKRNRGYVTENSGVVVFSGDGSTTQFKIEHGLASTPSKVIVTPLSADAKDFAYAEADDTYIYFNFSTAPPSGTDNVKLSWYAEA